jgi:HTH-type transcriptional regulator / antitoxin HipB
MIKNQKQAGITRQKLAELKKAKAELETTKGKTEPAKYELGIKSFDGLIKDLEIQLNEYECLTKGNFNCIKPESLEDLPKNLIAARLAQKMSHKHLGELVGLKEQQIQRYEATDYETASWPRIVEIALALKLKFSFESVHIINESDDDPYDYPDGITIQQVSFATESIRNHRSLII